MKIFNFFLFLTFVPCINNNIFSNSQIELSISESIVSNFLHARYKKTKNTSLWNNDTIEYKIFEIKWDPGLQDISMSIHREGEGDSSVVVITTNVQGAPEDFENKNILEVEKHLLKYKLIRSYLTKLDQSELKDSKAIPLDTNTKVIRRPEYMITVTHSYSMINETVYKERKSMEFMTIFTAREFNDLVKKYFTDSPNISAQDILEIKNRDTSLFFQGLAVGISVGAGSVLGSLFGMWKDGKLSFK